jgi:hypothetical protein
MKRRYIKLALASSGMVLAIVALALDDRRIMWGAIAVIAAALAMRFIPGQAEFPDASD